MKVKNGPKNTFTSYLIRHETITPPKKNSNVIKPSLILKEINLVTLGGLTNFACSLLNLPYGTYVLISNPIVTNIDF